MKLTYREKIVLAVVLAVAIFVGGFFGLIKPKTEAIKDNESTLETLETKKTEIERKIKRIDTVDKNIQNTYQASIDNTNVFVDEELIEETELLDGFMYDYAEKAHVKLMELNVDPITATAINYYYKPYVEVATALREVSDINGTFRQKVAEESADSNFIASRGVETIMGSRYGLTVQGTKDEIWAYLKQIENIDEAVIITSIEMEEVDEDEKEQDKATPAGGENQQNQQEKEKDENDEQPENWEKDTVLEANIVIQLYSVYEMEEPKTEMQKD